MNRYLIVILYILVFSSCQSNNQPLSTLPQPGTKTNAPGKNVEAPLLTPTSTQSPTIANLVNDTPSPTVTPTSEPKITTTLESSSMIRGNKAIIIDHNSLTLFDTIPDKYINGASDIRLLVRGASVEDNINNGLDCIWGNYPIRRPTHCFDYYNAKFDRSNWSLQFRGNPGWIDKVNDFVFSTEEQIDKFEVFTFVFGYVDGFDGTTYPEISNPEYFYKYYIEKIEALETTHPDKIFVMWTMSLARLGFNNTQKFNNMVRTYALEHGKYLLDIADIESHDPQGNKVTNEEGYEVIYSGYTNETKSGHLNKVGAERMAKAVWILMARISGWDVDTQ